MMVLTITSRLSRFASFTVRDLLVCASCLTALDIALRKSVLASFTGKEPRLRDALLIASNGAYGLRGLIVMNPPFWAIAMNFESVSFFDRHLTVSSLKNDSVPLSENSYAYQSELDVLVIPDLRKFWFFRPLAP